MNKVGVQLQAKPNDLEAMLDAQPASVKLLGAALDLGIARDVRARAKNAVIVGRGAGGDQDYRKGAQIFADYLAQLLEPFQREGLVDFAEHLNEPGFRDQSNLAMMQEDARFLNEHAVEFSRIMHSRGYKTIVYNFSVGVPKNLYIDGPTLTPWPLLKDGLAAADMLGLHEYSAPRMRDGVGAYCLRYRHVIDELGRMGLRIPIAITELGIDRGILAGQGGGYKNPANQTTIGDYVDDLKWYAGELAKDSQVKFAHVFLFGSGSVQWTTFDVADDENDRAQFVAFLHWNPAGSPPIPAPPPPTGGSVTTAKDRMNLAWKSIGVSFNPDAALFKKAAELKVGHPVGNEKYDGGLVTQGFRDAFVQCADGDWANAKAYDWLTGEPMGASPTPPPPVVTPPSSGLQPFDGSKAIAPVYFEEGHPIAGKPFYRVEGMTVLQGVGAYCYVTVLGKDGAPQIGVKVVNQWLNSQNGECVTTDGTGVAKFQFGTGSAVPDPATGHYPFSFAITADGFKDYDAKALRIGTIISDWARGVGDFDADHTQINIQYRQVQ